MTNRRKQSTCLNLKANEVHEMVVEQWEAGMKHEIRGGHEAIGAMRKPQRKQEHNRIRHKTESLRGQGYGEREQKQWQKEENKNGG